ncbi:MAG: hypothetical protein ABI579_00440 [Candidatus Sumerlaeota bacterium]
MQATLDRDPRGRESADAVKGSIEKIRAFQRTLNKDTQAQDYARAQFHIAHLLRQLAFSMPESERLIALREASAADREGADCCIALKDFKHANMLLSELGYVYSAMADYSSADHWAKCFKDAVGAFDEALKLTPRAGNEELIAATLTNKSVVQLLMKNYQGALDSADESLRLSRVHLGQQANRAHALVFVGRFPEAKIEYLKYLPDADFREGVIDDIRKFEKFGLPKAEIEKVRELLPK